MAGVGAQEPLLMFVGISPGWEDDDKGIPYTGPTGNIFREMLLDAGIKFSEVFITNAVRCASDDPQATHFRKCREHLIREIQAVRPRALVAIGGAAASQLIGKATNKIRQKAFACAIVPGLQVYAIPQPAILFHHEGRAKEQAEREIVEDLAWIKEQVTSGKTKSLRPQDYKTAKTLAEVDQIFEECTQDEAVAADFETNFLGRPYAEAGHHIAALGLSRGQGHGRIIPIHMKAIKTPLWWDERTEAKVKERTRNYLIKQLVYGHNFYSYDDLVARVLLGTPPLKIDFDTMLAQYCLDEEPPHDLEHVALRYTPFDELWKDKFNLDDPAELCRYLYMDVDATSQIRAAVEPQLVDGLDTLLHKILIPTGRTLTNIQGLGTKIDRDFLKILKAQIAEKQKEIIERIKALPEVARWEVSQNRHFNPGAPEQVGHVMEKILNLPKIKETASGGYCTNDEVLEHYKDRKFCEEILTLRKIGKLKGTYIEGIEERLSHTGLIHTSYKIITKTGRSSSADPNLQNLPRKATAGEFPIKKLFIPRTSTRCFVQFDYSQAELRVWASLSGDEKLIEAYLNGIDVHRATAAEAYGKDIKDVTDEERNVAKILNFGIIYGKLEATLVRDFVEAAEESARKRKVKFTRLDRAAAEDRGRLFFRKHQETFKAGWAWLNEQERIVLEEGVQYLPSGRRRRHRKADHSAVREGKNTPVQSLANECCFEALRVLEARLPEIEGADAHLVLTVHDSIVAETEIEKMWEVADLGYNVMTGVHFDWMKVPMEVDVEAGLNYGELRKLNLKTRTVKE